MPSEQFNQYFQALTAEYRAALPDKLRHIESLWKACTDGVEPLARMQTLLRELHSIAGAASTFGLPAVGEAAAAAEGFLGPLCAAGTLPSAVHQIELDALLLSLKQVAEAQ